MESRLSLTSCCSVLLLIFAQILRSAELTTGVRRAGPVGMRGPGAFGGQVDSISRRGRPVPPLPSPVQDPGDEGGHFSGAFEQTGPEQPQRRRGFRGFRGNRLRPRPLKRGKVHRYGKFNSDTHGCRDIQSRSCAEPADCSGCLGLYTCDITMGGCKLKGLSRTTDVFFQSLQDI